jgi:hypothetical protein
MCLEVVVSKSFLKMQIDLDECVLKGSYDCTVLVVGIQMIKYCQ